MVTTSSRFRIDVPDETLADLRARLDHARWPDHLLVVGREDGDRLRHVHRLWERWRSDFDWRRQERQLNDLPQHLLEVDGMRLHVVHARSASVPPRPLLPVHGWPSSFVEYARVVPLPTAAPPGPGFDVVVPTRPGYGFSDAGRLRDGSEDADGDLFTRLMTDVLGYDRFLAHGDDFGGSIVSRMACRHPGTVRAIHVSEWLEPPVPDGASLGPDERRYLESLAAWREAERGYGHIAATRPQTLGLALDDSPLGLLAWIADKFLSWTDPRPDGRLQFDADFLLTVTTLYWVTRSMTTSMRSYAAADAGGGPVPVPAGVVAPREEHPAPPRSWLERSYADLRSYRIRTRGGHFLAAEDPGAFVAELTGFFAQVAPRDP
ncbi:epoxide hydrolase family protein [Modestobacter marinus]|uniref:epoxide hydrolase family protein n=1 Tax=Modestobacter marinus TaxID=477641 RepID=UPI001C972B3D|nr:epoxide hydrolase [Modestobacter marinus]